jgi:hypothetical protein
MKNWTWQKKVAFICWIIPTLALYYMGIEYLTSTQIRPYHLEAIRLTWEQLVAFDEGRVAKLMVLFVNGFGAGFLSTALSLTFMLAFPYYRGRKWSTWALFLVACSMCVPLLFIVHYVKFVMGGNPPWALLITTAPVMLIAFLLSLWNDSIERAKGLR